MDEKRPQYNSISPSSMQYNTCYKHSQSVPLSICVTPPTAHSATIASSPGLGLMTALNAPRHATVIPNRIFVGGIDFKTSEQDLQEFFSAFGAVRDTKIIRDRAEVSKGYGFVTFSSIEEANKARDQEDCLYLNGKKLNIGQAMRKQQTFFPKDIHVPGPLCSWVIHPGGYASYTNANGITYFHPTPPLLPAQVTVPGQQPYIMAYSGSPAPALGGIGQQISQYAGFNQSTGGMQQLQGSLALPWTPTHAGSCGQILAPVSSLEPSQSMNLSVIPIVSSNSLPAANATPASCPPVPTIASSVQSKGSPVPPAAVPQTHIQMPTSYVCSPIPGQQAVPVRFNPHAEQPMLHAVTGSAQPVMHSVNYGQQICSTPTMVSTAHEHMAMPTGNNSEFAAVTIAEGNIMPTYGMQQAIYPPAGLIGSGSVELQYATVGNHQPSEVLTPPPTPEIQAQQK